MKFSLVILSEALVAESKDLPSARCVIPKPRAFTSGARDLARITFAAERQPTAELTQ